MALPHPPTMSVEAYFQLSQSSPEICYEYLDGEVYALAGGTIAHARIALNIAKWLDEQVQEPCHVYTSDVRVQIAETRYVYPDVSISCEQSDWQEQADTIHAPRLIVEVLSPTTEAYDRGKKFAYYQECTTIQEYVLVNSQYQGVEIFRRRGDMWTYRRFAPGQVVELESLALHLPVAALYEHTRVPVRDSQKEE